jgi:phage shock protein C
MGVADRLYRSRDDRMLAGVAAGVAEALDADPSIIRIAWALLAIFTGGIAFVVYIVMAIVVPEGPGEFSRQGPWGPVAGPPASPPPETGPGSPPAYWSDDREARRAARRARRASEPGRGGLIAGAILVVIGAFFLVREFIPWFDWNLWWPIGLIGLGALLLVVALTPGRRSD